MRRPKSRSRRSYKAFVADVIAFSVNHLLPLPKRSRTVTRRKFTTPRWPEAMEACLLDDDVRIGSCRLMNPKVVIFCNAQKSRVIRSILRAATSGQQPPDGIVHLTPSRAIRLRHHTPGQRAVVPRRVHPHRLRPTITPRLDPARADRRAQRTGMDAPPGASTLAQTVLNYIAAVPNATAHHQGPIAQRSPNR